MQVDELRRALADGERVGPAGRVDLAVVRARGRRLRLYRHAAVAGTVAVVLAVGAAGTTRHLLGGGGGNDTTTVVAASPEPTRPSAYGRRVLRTVPHSYAVGGVVVVPGAVDPHSELNRRIRARELKAPVVPLGWNANSQPGYIDSPTRYPAFMQGNPPRDARVVADNGPASLSCVAFDGKRPCTVAVLLGDQSSGWFYEYGLGGDDFLRRRAAMQVFLREVYDHRVARQSVVGGFDGTRAARVELTLTDGTTEQAALDSGRISRGDTLFWATVRGHVAAVTAYDAAGERIAQHRVRYCTDPVDCEVR